MQNPKTRIALAVFVLVLSASSLACNAAAASRIAPPTPPPAVETGASADALGSFNEKWRGLNISTPDGPFSVTFTEAELTSAIQAAIDQAEADSGQALPVNDVQVVLGNGVIDVFGHVTVEPLNVNGKISVSPSINSAGMVQLDVISAEFGVFQLDDALLNSVIDNVEHSINQPIQASPMNITLTEVSVDNGELRVSGVINP